MAQELPHVRGSLNIAGIGNVSELESFTVTYEGDPEVLRALEGAVGALLPTGLSVNMSGVVFIPYTMHAYTKIVDYWKAGTRVECASVYGNRYTKAVGRFNAPEITDDGTKLSFTFIGQDPVIRDL